LLTPAPRTPQRVLVVRLTAAIMLRRPLLLTGASEVPAATAADLASIP